MCMYEPMCLVCVAEAMAVSSLSSSTEHHSRYNALVCGEEWVFFNAAQVRVKHDVITYTTSLIHIHCTYTNVYTCSCM